MSRWAAAAAIVSVLFLAAFMGFLCDARPDQTMGPPVPASSAVGTPSVRDAHQMAYDAESNRVVLFGGNGRSLPMCGLRDTWTYDVANNSWTDMSSTVAPPGRCCPGMTYDSAADRVILFGGVDIGAASGLNDTWAYDLNTNTWTELTPVVSPPGRVGAQLVYDVHLDRVVLFGGHSMGTPQVGFNDTWTYEFSSNSWTRVNTNGPGARPFEAMAYDTESERVVVFGGMAAEPYYPDSETWVYDAANETWEQMTPGTSPSPRFGAAATYDAKADRVLVFGGGYEAGRNDTWAYDLNADAWTKIDTASKPSDRLSAMAYNAKSDQTVLFGGSWPWGGIGEPVFNRETWVLDYGNRTWTMVLGPLPPVAAFTTTPSAPVVGDTVTFDGSASSDADGNTVWFVWDFRDGSPPSGSSIAVFDHVFSSAGTYDVRLTVTDDEGLTNTTMRQVVVRPVPDTTRPVVAIATPADGATLTSATATVTGTALDDVGVAKVEVSLDNATWIVASGTTEWSATLTLAEGSNTIHVRVTDTSDNVATSTIQVTVAGPGTPVWIWLLAGLGIAAAAAAAYLTIRRRTKPAKETRLPPR